LRTNADVPGYSVPDDLGTHRSDSTDAPADRTGAAANRDRSDELAAAAKTGNEEAIERLWTHNEAALRICLSRYLSDPRDVAEASQEVFIRMLQGLPQYEVGEVPFRFWLLRIARNYAIDVLRREKHSQVERDDRLNRLREEAGEAPLADEAGWLHDERTQLAVSSLPVEQQRMLLLRFGFGYRSEEVARLLGCSPAAVRQQQSRALRRLEETLQTAHLSVD
jgi:RNA polymerase sigma-70 factor, ECF subfamily